jgi:hypothetical protein
MLPGGCNVILKSAGQTKSTQAAAFFLIGMGRPDSGATCKGAELFSAGVRHYPALARWHQSQPEWLADVGLWVCPIGLRREPGRSAIKTSRRKPRASCFGPLKGEKRGTPDVRLCILNASNHRIGRYSVWKRDQIRATPGIPDVWNLIMTLRLFCQQRRLRSPRVHHQRFPPFAPRWVGWGLLIATPPSAIPFFCAGAEYRRHRVSRMSAVIGPVPMLSTSASSHPHTPTLAPNPPSQLATFLGSVPHFYQSRRATGRHHSVGNKSEGLMRCPPIVNEVGILQDGADVPGRQDARLLGWDKATSYLLMLLTGLVPCLVTFVSLHLRRDNKG